MRRNDEISEELKNCHYSRNVTLPSNIDFYLNNEFLKIYMSKDYVKKNMQTNEAAFEGWALCLKRWLKDKPGIKQVKLEWEEPKNINNNHYQRFLYRVKNFDKLYSWFEIINREYLNNLELNYREDTKYLINSDWNRKAENLNKSEKNDPGEKDLEYILAGQNSLLNKYFDLDNSDIGFQLPVGIFKEKESKANRIFPGNKSAIDLFAIKGDTTYIFELKFASKMVGIISQVYFYSYIIRDLQENNLTWENEDNKYLKDISSTQNIKSIMLADVFHPLIDNEVIREMNNNQQKNINFSAAKIKFNEIEITDFKR